MVRPGLSVVLLIAVLNASPARATTWAGMSDDAVAQWADVIVRGKVAEVREKDERYPGVELGVVEVTEVIYGHPDLAKVRLVLDEHNHGLSYQPGDTGTWFLRVRPPGGARQDVKEGWRPPVLGRARDTVFTASHPATFWPADAKGERDRGMREATPEQREERRRDLLKRVEDRLRKDIAALTEAAEAASRNLDGVRRAATRPSETDRDPEPSE